MECDSDYIEYIVSLKVMINPHPNIVNIYKVTTTYIDMELLYVRKINKKINFADVYEAIKHLHSLNIVYIDLKFDNLGISIENSNTKLFDFNCCGILLNDYSWLFKPVDSKNYRIFKHTPIKYFKEYDYILLDILIEKNTKKTCWNSILNIFLIN
jgi:serine/threonine protein kinase